MSQLVLQTTSPRRIFIYLGKCSVVLAVLKDSNDERPPEGPTRKLEIKELRLVDNWRVYSSLCTECHFCRSVVFRMDEKKFVLRVSIPAGPAVLARIDIETASIGCWDYKAKNTRTPASSSCQDCGKGF